MNGEIYEKKHEVYIKVLLIFTPVVTCDYDLTRLSQANIIWRLRKKDSIGTYRLYYSLYDLCYGTIFQCN